MTPVHDFDFIAIMHLRPHIATPHRSFSQRRNRIQTCKGPRSRLNAQTLSRNLPAHEREDFRLELQNSLFGAQDLAFPFFQRSRGESFSVRQSLSSFIVFGYARSIRFRNLDEVTEDVVVA